LEAKELLLKLAEASGISGYEHEPREILREELKAYADEILVDPMGSLIAIKKGNRRRGEGGEPHRIMLAGHLDEIGLMVTKIEKGYLRFTQVGGFDLRVLPGQEVVVHGTTPLPGVIGCRPPHLLTEEEREKVTPMDELFIDVGLDEKRAAELVQVGDLASINRQAVSLKEDIVAGKAFDDRASVVAIVECFKHLATAMHAWDVYGVATVQEETGYLGAITSAFRLFPDLAIAIDVSHADMPGVPESETILLGKGPGIALGANIHPKIHERLVQTAKSLEIPFQIEPYPGATGTDAWAIQVTREGIPTGLLDIPLRYMHTSVETLSVADVQRAGRLLASFIAGLEDKKFLEFEHASSIAF